ncbi:phosphatase PAP2 family protein [uncultured Eubacterium sp.]|uniref:phosphatase PAP2 family protein n=1 Tax=uncultured Eubacterium sp. TaxID=165185 RepID=UPI0026728B8A|nr:phosphatase PAP2 family protein [uncultured Eubacterium sp.]
MNRIKNELRKYKHAWPLLYVFIYMPWFIFLENKIPATYPGLHIIHCAIDDIIPFCELFVIPYLLWFLYIPAVFVFLFYHSKNEFYRICAYEFTGMTIALLVCTVYPNGLELRLSEITGNNILTDLVRFLYDSDTPTNVCPSIHVFATIAAHICLIKSPHMKELKPRQNIKRISLVLSILICLSTMFLKQHSVIDVISGFVLAFVLYFVVFHWWFKNVKFPAPIVKDPHQHQVLYFLNKKKK